MCETAAIRHETATFLFVTRFTNNIFAPRDARPLEMLPIYVLVARAAPVRARSLVRIRCQRVVSEIQRGVARPLPPGLPAPARSEVAQ